MAYQISVEEILGEKKSANKEVAASQQMDFGRIIEVASNRGIRALELMNEILKNANQLKGSGQSIAGAFGAKTPELTDKQKEAEANMSGSRTETKDTKSSS